MARFVLDDMITRARRLARTTSNTVSDEEVKNLINEGLREFGMNTQGLWSHELITLWPRFDFPGTSDPIDFYAFQLRCDHTSATIVVDNSVFMATGTTVATLINLAITTDPVAVNFATATCYWDANAWRMAIEIPSSSFISVEAPTVSGPVYYEDVREYLFGAATATQASDTFIGAFPQDMTLETELPTGFLSMEWVLWDGVLLKPWPPKLFMSPQSYGTPAYYSIINKSIRVIPYPTEQKRFEVWFKKLPTEYGVVATATGSGSSSASSPLTQEFELAPMYYAASIMAEENHEGQIADRFRAKFLLQCYKYTQQYANQNPKIFPVERPFRQPDVDPETP